MLRVLRITPQRRRTLVSGLFGLTFFASMLTVAASKVLPCPVRNDRRRYGEGDEDVKGRGGRVEKKSRRWIEEREIPRDACGGRRRG